MDVAANVAPERHLVTLDPQTSGGLLITVSPSAVDDLRAAMNGRAMLAEPIGRVEQRSTRGHLVRLV